MTSHWKIPAALAVLLLAACSGTTTPSTTNPGSTDTGGGTDTGGDTGGNTPPPPTATTFFITPAPKTKDGPDATAQMVNAMVTAVPGDTIQFDCGFFDLKTTLQLANTENIHVKGCGKDKTVLSFRNSPGQVGILAVTMRGLWVDDLTVADTAGNGFELRGVDHGYLTNVRAIWSSGRGTGAEKTITKDNFGANGAAILHVPCTHPATLNPNVPENQYPGADISSPDYTVSDLSGRYGIYPVSSDNIWIRNSESIGASDAGIYVGQTNNTIIENSRAAYNVFGFEIENVRGGEYRNNVAECNTGGFLVYDLDGNLRQYGHGTTMHDNVSRMNNTYNFTHGGFVANVPPGSGMITLSYDRIDIYNNQFVDNNTAGIIHTSYAIFPAGDQPSDRRLDFYSEGVHVWHNTFRNNGASLPIVTTKDLWGGDVTQTDPTTVDPTDPPQPNPDVARLLPALVGLKNQAACAIPTNAPVCAAVEAAHLQTQGSNCSDPSKCMNTATGMSEAKVASGFRGAHIVWDGLVDAFDANCKYPSKDNGYAYDVPPDTDGKPQWTNQYPNPACHYNGYKFDTAATPPARKAPLWSYSCIDEDNDFSADSLTFANFHGRDGIDGVIALSNGDAPTPDEMAAIQNFPSTFDIAPQRCATKLPPLPEVVIPPFVPSTGSDAAPTPAEIAALCGAAVPAGRVNFDAAARVNCPTLDQYHLFSNPEDPRSAPNSSAGDYDTSVPGVPFVLNTKLFSDYAVKYRVLFMPNGTKAIYKDASTDGVDATIIFPVGTIIAKTFAFADGADENIVETRLLIKRVNNATHAVRWDPLDYIWSVEDGKHVAKLSPSGGTAPVKWNYVDVDTHETHSGATAAYLIPNSNQCLSCHSRLDTEPGAAPIGLKVRNLNRAYTSESPNSTGNPVTGPDNQVKWLCDRGLMLGCPSFTLDANQNATNLERLPRFNVPGDSGAAANSAKDLQDRVRAYLEVNCQHCHNVNGYAASTGLYLNSIGNVDVSYGICKHPTATGAQGSDGRTIDIYPARPDLSILEYRLSDQATTPASMMPPLGRTVTHTEGHDLVRDWIRDVVKVDEAAYPNSSHCGE